MKVHNFPHQSTSFVGRIAELDDIAAHLADAACRLLTLVGPGGIGKTRLALEAARHITFADGVHFVPLQPLTSPDLIVSAVANALSLQFYSGSDPRGQLLSYLQEKSLLLILDNFEHLLADVSLLTDILASASAVKLFITSRERLNLSDEWVLDVGGLSFPTSDLVPNLEQYSAVQLLLQNAHRVNPGFSLSQNAVVVTRICNLLEGMPLSLELAASWLHVLTCAEIIKEIERSIDILQSSARDIPVRHRSMRAVLHHSWNLLSEADRDIFKKLSVFRGGFTREAAQAVAGASLHTLMRLIDTSWLRHNENDRYDLHELPRQFGEQQLLDSGKREAVREAHSAYFAAFLQQKWAPFRTEQQVIALDAIAVEFENLRAAWKTMTEKRKTVELTAAVYPLWYFCDLRGRYHEAIELFEQAYTSLCPAVGDPLVDRAIGQMLSRLGFLMITFNKHEEGLALTQEGLAIFQSVGSPEDIVMALTSLCMIHERRHEPLMIMAYAEQGMEIARFTDDFWLQAGIASQLTYPPLYRGDLPAAQQAAQEHYRLASASGDLWLRAMALGSLKTVAQEMGNYAEARKLNEQSLQLLEQVGQDCMLAAHHCGLGQLDYLLKDYSSAAHHYRQALLILADHSGYVFHVVQALLLIAELFVAYGKQERAVELFTVIVNYPTDFANEQSQAKQMLSHISAVLESSAFAAAQRRSYGTEIRVLVRELIVELNPPDPIAVTQPIANPLIPRELEILRLVAEGLSNHDIAGRLYFTVSTVKWYLSEIYSKLGVHGRMQAVSRARELGLLV